MANVNENLVVDNEENEEKGNDDENENENENENGNDVENEIDDRPNYDPDNGNAGAILADDVNNQPLIEGELEEEEENAYLDAEMVQRYGIRTKAYNLCARKPRDYSHMHATLEETVMTQHSMKRGLTEFGDAGVEAVFKELQQLHDRKVLEPKNANHLTDDERHAALQYLMFLKKKRNGTIKGRGCADRRKQRAHTSKEEASSPTVAIEAVMLSCVTDAMERRDVATVDIPGAFMQADMEQDTVHMKLEGKMAELLVRIDNYIGNTSNWSEVNMSSMLNLTTSSGLVAKLTTWQSGLEVRITVVFLSA
jgi:hypothetical protein